jgi:hypothetical protein
LADAHEQELHRPREADIWTASVLLLLGAVLAGLLIFKVFHDGGDASYQLARLGLVIPVLVVTALAALVVFGSRRVRVSPKAFLLVAALAGAIGNLAIPVLALGSRAWGNMIPLERPFGIDFRTGLYDPAVAFSTAKSAWPPLNLIVGWPFTLVSQDAGYYIQVVLLVVLALAAVVLSVNLGRRAIAASGGEGRTMIMVSALWLLTSYGFLFELERGNVDLYALLFSLLAVWSLLRLPRSVWVPAVLLALAVNLKLYPAILLILIFWRHRWRAVLPVVVSNAALMLIAGPGNAWTFIENNLRMQSDPSLWLGNHSAESFAFCLHQTFPWVPTSMKYVFLAVPVALWLATAVVLIRRGWSQRGAVLLAASSVPLMNVVPAVSHDYKLVLLVFPLAVLGALLAQPGNSRLASPAWRGTLLGLVGLEMAALSVSTLFWSDGSSYSQIGYGNKYPLVVFVQVLLLGVVLLLRREDDPERQGATAVLEVGRAS